MPSLEHEPSTHFQKLIPNASISKITDSDSDKYINFETQRPIWPIETQRIMDLLQKKFPSGMGVVGFESSDPVVVLEGDNPDVLTRRNQLLEAEDFYTNIDWRLGNIHDLGVRIIRIGEGYSQVHTGPDQYNWELMDKIVQKSEELDTTIIADLVHFGAGDWIHADTPEQQYFQSLNFPNAVAEYAKEFTQRYPTIEYFTTINEPFVTAKKSALRGQWNERKSDDASFARAAVNIAKAAILSKEVIEEVWRQKGRDGTPLFFQNESFERGLPHNDHPNDKEVDLFNLRKFVPLDLIFGHHDERVKGYLLTNGISNEEYNEFMHRGNKRNVILGIDHYPSSVQRVISATQADYCTPADAYLFPEIVKEYSERYGHPPMLHMEVNWEGEYGETLLDMTHNALRSLQNEGYPIIPGLTYYGDNNFDGWYRHLLVRGTHSPGLFNGREKLPIADKFKEMLAQGFGSTIYEATHLQGD